MTKPVVYKIIPNMALDDSKRLFLGIAGYVMPKLRPEDREPLAEIFNRFQPQGARDAVPQPSNRKDQPMPGNSVQAVMSYLKTKLSDNDLAELADILSQSASGELNGENQNPIAMEMMQALDLARKETTEVLGPQAHDAALNTASKVYGAALARMGVAFDGVNDAIGRRAIYRTAVNGRRATGQPLIALDAKSAASLAERFPGAARIRLGG